MRAQKYLTISSFIAFALNLLWGGIVLGQSNQSTVNINRTGSLSFYDIPSSFNFGTTTVQSTKTPTFSDPLVTAGSLPAGKKITVQDTRGEGGFTVTLSANGDFSDGGSNTIAISNTAPNDNLRIVTSPLVTGVTGTTTSGIVYETGFAGPQTVNAQVTTSSNNFAEEGTFTGVTGNVLDTTVPVDVFDGTLASTDGRIGRMSAGVSAMLQIPAFQADGQYVTTLTWTLTDSTT